MTLAASPRGFSPALNANAPVDARRLLSIFLRHLRLFLIVAAVTAFVVLALTIFGTPRYTSTATLLINQHSTDVLHLNTVTPQDAEIAAMGADSSAVDTQVQILRSRALASSVVDQLNLISDPEFNGKLRPPGKLDALTRAVGGGGSSSNNPLNDPALAPQREREGVIDQVMRDLVVKRIGLTYTIDLSFTAFSPTKAAALANAFLQTYLTQNLSSKIDENHTATSWLDTRLAQLRQEVETADQAVQQYKIANNLLTASGATLTEQEISSVDLQLAQTRAQEAEQDARLHTAERQLAGGSNGGDVGEALNNPVIGSLRTQRAQASAQLADLEARYGDKHPSIQKAKRSLADIDAQIQTEIQRVISNLKAQSQIAHTRTASLASTVAQSRGQLAGNNRDQVHLNELQRNYDSARAIYDGFLTRYKETVAKEGIQPTDARVVTQAKLPTSPSSPNIRLDVAIALVLGLLFGSAAALLAELFARGVTSAADVESVFGLPSLGEIPTLVSTLPRGTANAAKISPIAYVVNKPLSRFAEAFRNLRTSVAGSKTGERVQVIAITSSLPGEGKTTTTMCLARTIALSGSSIVVVDCDLRQRSLNRLLDSEPEVGLLEVLSGTASLDRAIYRDEESGAHFLLCAKTSFAARNVFESDAMKKLIADLRQRFDYVVLDTAPVLAVADTRVLAPQADAVIFLTRWRRTSKKAVLAALRALEIDQTFVAGIALTQVNVREQARSGESAAHYYRATDRYYTG